MKRTTRRVLWVGGSVLIGLWSFYLVGANLLLRTEAGQSWVASKTRNTQIRWQGAVTWIPGRVRVDALDIEGGRRQRWSIALEDVQTRVRLLDLVLKRVYIPRARIGAFEFGLVEVEDPPPPRSRRPQRDLEGGWRLVVDRARVDRVRRVEVRGLALEGEGTLEAGLELWFRGAMSFPHLDLRMPDSRIVGEDGESVADLELLEVKGDLERFPTRRTRLEDFFSGAALSARLAGQVVGVGFLENYLTRAPWLSFDRGGGRLELAVELAQGQFGEGSRMVFTGDRLGVGLLDYHFAGNPELRGEVPAGGNPVLDLQVADYQLAREGDVEPYLRGPKLRLRTEASSRTLFPRPDQRIRFELEEGEVPDVTVFNETLGAVPGIGLQSGSATLSSFLVLDTAGPASEPSRIVFRGRDLGLRYRDLDVTGDLDVVSVLTALDPGERLFAVERIELELADADFVQAEQTMSEGWEGSLLFERGQVALSEPVEVDADVSFRLTDARPIWAFFADRKPVLGVVGKLLSLRGLEGESKLEMGAGRVWVHDIGIEAQGLRLEGAMCLRQDRPEGALWALVHGIGVSAWIEDGRRNWSLLHPRRAYERHIDSVTCAQP